MVSSYGHKYRRAAEYLEKLAGNEFWANAQFPRLPWHETVRPSPALGQPQYAMNDALLSALAPSVPLRVVWQGNRNQ